MLILFSTAGTNIFSQSPYRLDVEKVAENIYVFKPSTASKDIVDANCIAIIGKNAVWLVDGHQRGSMIKQTLAKLKAITKLPVKYIINTHFHGDHNFSNYQFKKTYPGAAIIAHPYTAAQIDSFTIPTMKDIGAGYTKTIKYVEDALKAKKKGADTLVGYALVRWKETLRDCYEIAKDYKGVDVNLVRADITVSDTLRFNTGKEWIEIFHMPASHTKGDLVVWVPAKKILVIGDIVVSPAPYAFGSNHKNWQEILDRMKALNPSLIIPGHGKVQSDLSYVDQLSQLLKAMEISSTKNYVKGMKQRELRDKVEKDMKPYELYFGQNDPEKTHAFYNYFVYPSVQSYFTELSK